MKGNAMSKTVVLSEETKKQLITEVKETLATEANENSNRKFTVVDMWNRQRNSRSASDRMRRWNLN
jgi:hypothetical protein